MNQVIYNKLVETARAGELIAYSDIAPLAGLNLESPADRNRLA